MDGLLPSLQLQGPLLSHRFYFLRWELGLLLGDEDGVDDDFRRVGLDGGRAELGAEDVGEITTDLECGDGGVEGCACELEGAAYDSDAAVLALFTALAEVGEDRLESPKELQCA